MMSCAQNMPVCVSAWRASPVSYIDKNRAARKEITRREDKILMQQATSFEKYKAVFSRLGLDFEIPKEAPLAPKEPPVGIPEKAVGIAPLPHMTEKSTQSAKWRQ